MSATLLPEMAETTPSDAPQSTTFKDLGLNPNLVQALEASGYVAPTPIQAESIPYLLAGRDLIGQAQTGTGKTAAFALPLLQTMDLKKSQTQVLVLTPTRELAIQVAEAFERYAGGVKAIRVAAIYGGQDYMVQFRQLDRGAHVVVGTPGRVMDHMRRGSLSLDGLRCLVLDEADEMLRMGFAEDVEWVLESVPEQRQIALFSATLPDQIRNMAQKYLRDPAEITIAQKSATADTIRQRYVIAAPGQKESALARLLEAEETDGVIVFVKTKSSTEPLAEYLNHHGHRAVALHGDIAQKQRERILDNLRNGKINIVVATDVAARGLDVQRISHVVNYDLLSTAKRMCIALVERAEQGVTVKPFCLLARAIAASYAAWNKRLAKRSNRWSFHPIAPSTNVVYRSSTSASPAHWLIRIWKLSCRSSRSTNKRTMCPSSKSPQHWRQWFKARSNSCCAMSSSNLSSIPCVATIAHESDLVGTGKSVVMATARRAADSMVHARAIGRSVAAVIVHAMIVHAMIDLAHVPSVHVRALAMQTWKPIASKLVMLSRSDRATWSARLRTKLVSIAPLSAALKSSSVTAPLIFLATCHRI